MKKVQRYFFILLGVFACSTLSAQSNQPFAIQKQKVDSCNEVYRQLLNKRPFEAYTTAKEALSISQEISYAEGIATGYNNLGVFYKNQGDYSRALMYYHKALSIQDSLRNKQGIAYLYNNIGTIHSLNGNASKALTFYNKAYAIFIEQDDTAKIIGTLNNIGNVYTSTGDLDSALSVYNLAKDFYRRSPDKNLFFDPAINIGNIYYKTGNFEEALNFYLQGLKTEDSLRDKFGQAKCYQNLAATYFALKEFEQSENVAREGIALASLIEAKPVMQSLYGTLSDIYRHRRDFEKAYFYLNKYHATKDSLFNEEKNRQFTELETAYQIKQKEKEIELLKKEATISRLKLKTTQIYTIGAIIIALLFAMLVLIVYRRGKENQKVNRILAQQYKEILDSKAAIEEQKKIIENKNQNFTDSVEYAKSIQEGILSRNDFREKLPNSFIYYKPKDIVSGDFYWFHQEKGQAIMALIDCTGHGVAGAFMTIIGNSLLNQIVLEDGEYEPDKILTQLDQKLMDTLKQQEVKTSNHGMDVSICKIDFTKETLYYAGARRPLYLIEEGQLEEIKGDKFTLGESFPNQNKYFTVHKIPFKPHHRFYLFSDGYIDQFGGRSNKKYMAKRFKKLLLNLQGQTMRQQGESLALEMKRWMRYSEQTDDMVVIGFSLKDFS